MKNWHGIMTVLEMRHLDADGRVLYEERNIRNMIHKSGEKYILGILFSNTPKPSNYYVGLDARTTLATSQTIMDVKDYEPGGVNSPSKNGYERQAVSSTVFQIDESSATVQAKTPTLVFRASNGDWGPVKNIFLTNSLASNQDVILLSSAALSRNIVVSNETILTMRMSMSLSNC